MTFWPCIFVWGFLAPFSLHFLLLSLGPLLHPWSSDVFKWRVSVRLFCSSIVLASQVGGSYPSIMKIFLILLLSQLPFLHFLFSLWNFYYFIFIISQILLPGLIFKPSYLSFPILYFYTFCLLSEGFPYNVTFQTFCPGFHFSSPLFVVSVLLCCLNCLFPLGFILSLFVPGDSYRHWKKKRKKKLCTWFQDGGEHNCWLWAPLGWSGSKSAFRGEGSRDQLLRRGLSILLSFRMFLGQDPPWFFVSGEWTFISWSPGSGRWVVGRGLVAWL